MVSGTLLLYCQICLLSMWLSSSMFRYNGKPSCPGKCAEVFNSPWCLSSKLACSTVCLFWPAQSCVFVAAFYSSAAASEDAQQNQVEKENCFDIFKSAMYELHSFILKLTANENIGPVPGQATCRSWESRLPRRAQPELLDFWLPFSLQGRLLRNQQGELERNLPVSIM